MTHMNSAPRHFLVQRFLTILLLIVGIHAVGHAQVFHGGDFRKTPRGPRGVDGTMALPGDTVNTMITYINLDDFNDTHLVTALRDTVVHASGSITSPNL